MASDINIKYFSIFFILLTYSLPTEQRHSRRDDENYVDEEIDASLAKDVENTDDVHPDVECWLSLSAEQHFTIMDNLDQKYAKARTSFHRKMANRLNAKMLKAMVETRGIAYRAIHNTAGDASQIPAGLHLGGHCMIIMEDSVLFFYRMKLRNNTVFQVNSIENDLMNMTVQSQLSLHDLHLVGAYERSPVHKDPSVLFYVPNAGEIDVLLKNVNYKMEGRLRLQGNRLIVETVMSEFIIEDILMTYTNPNSSHPTISFYPNNFGDFLDRIKNDLDLWIKDFFNDYYTYFQLNDVDPEFRQYERSRIVAYNHYSDYIIKRIKQRIYELEIFHIKTPKFTLNALPNVQVQLSNGVIRGLDTIFKKSLATGRRKRDVRHIDMTIGFSSLKVEYKLDVILPNGGPITTGHLQLAADDLTALLQVSMVQRPETVDMKFYFIKQVKPIALTVEGAANRLIANYKHLLENHIIIIMLNELLENIKNLGTITRCKPFFHPVNELQGYLRRTNEAQNKRVMQNSSKQQLQTAFRRGLFDFGKQKAQDVLDFERYSYPYGQGPYLINFYRQHPYIRDDETQNKTSVHQNFVGNAYEYAEDKVHILESDKENPHNVLEYGEDTAHNALEHSEDQVHNVLEYSKDNAHNALEHSEDQVHNVLEYGKDNAYNALEHRKDQVHNVLEYGKDKAHNVLEYGKHKAHNVFEYGKHKVHNILEYGKDKVHNILEYGKEKSHGVFDFGKNLMPKIPVYIQMTPDSPPIGPVLISFVQ